MVSRSLCSGVSWQYKIIIAFKLIFKADRGLSFSHSRLPHRSMLS